MNEHKVLFLPHNKEITVQDGERLIRAAMEAGVHINASCGGEGICGKCRVIIEEGNIEGGITEKLSEMKGHISGKLKEFRDEAKELSDPFDEHEVQAPPPSFVFWKDDNTIHTKITFGSENTNSNSR